MSRFISVASPSGVVADTLGTGSTTFCGSGTQLYDVPGALTPIYVCCNWTTPINGFVNIDVNFSLYDCLVVRGTSTTHCCNQSAGVMVLPSNACIDNCLCTACYCACNMFIQAQYGCGTCNATSAQGCLCTGTMGCWNRVGYWQFVFKQGHGTYACESQCKCQAFAAEITHTVYSNFSKKVVQLSPSCRAIYQGFWPTTKVDSIEKLPQNSFCKFVIRGSNYHCFTPLLCCTCEVDGAFFGVWGSLRSNPYVSGKDSAYKCA